MQNIQSLLVNFTLLNSAGSLILAAQESNLPSVLLWVQLPNRPSQHLSQALSVTTQTWDLCFRFNYHPLSGDSTVSQRKHWSRLSVESCVRGGWCVSFPSLFSSLHLGIRQRRPVNQPAVRGEFFSCWLRAADSCFLSVTVRR